MAGAKSEIKKFSLNNQAISPKETLRNLSSAATFGTERTFRFDSPGAKNDHKEMLS